MKIRPVAVLPALALACVSLTACDSKAGAAAVVDGHKISESTLTKYVPANTKPIQTNNGATSTPARSFVLRLLVQNEISPRLLAAGGAPVTPQSLAAAKAKIIASGGTEQALADQITGAGLSAKLEPAYLQFLEYQSLLQSTLTTAAAQQKAIAGVKNIVSINPRYGSWDDSTVSLTDLSKKDLPSGLTFSGTLPGDVTTAPSQ